MADQEKKTEAGKPAKASPAKISSVEAYYLVAFALIADLINWVPGLNIIVTVVTLPALQIYLTIKGVRGWYGLAGNLAELIPFLSILPAITAGVVATIIVDRLQTTEVGAKAAQALKAGGAGK